MLFFASKKLYSKPAADNIQAFDTERLKITNLLKWEKQTAQKAVSALECDFPKRNSETGLDQANRPWHKNL